MFMWMSSNSSRKFAAGDLSLDPVQAVLDGRLVGRSDHAHGRQHGRVRARSGQVLAGQATIEADRHIDGLHQLGRLD
jgi:hypothetical protein